MLSFNGLRNLAQDNLSQWEKLHIIHQLSLLSGFLSMTHKDTVFIIYILSPFMKMTMYLSVKRDVVLWPNFRISQQIDKVSERNASFIIIDQDRSRGLNSGLWLVE